MELNHNILRYATSNTTTGCGCGPDGESGDVSPKTADPRESGPAARQPAAWPGSALTPLCPQAGRPECSLECDIRAASAHRQKPPAATPPGVSGESRRTLSCCSGAGYRLNCCRPLNCRRSDSRRCYRRRLRRCYHHRWPYCRRRHRHSPWRCHRRHPGSCRSGWRRCVHYPRSGRIRPDGCGKLHSGGRGRHCSGGYGKRRSAGCGRPRSGDSGWLRYWVGCGRPRSGDSGWLRCWAGCGRRHLGGSGRLRSGGSDWLRCWAGCGRRHLGGSGRLRSGGSDWPRCWAGCGRRHLGGSGRPRLADSGKPHSAGSEEFLTVPRRRRHFLARRAVRMTAFSLRCRRSVRQRAAWEMSLAGSPRRLLRRG